MKIIFSGRRAMTGPTVTAAARQLRNHIVIKIDRPLLFKRGNHYRKFHRQFLIQPACDTGTAVGQRRHKTRGTDFDNSCRKGFIFHFPCHITLTPCLILLQSHQQLLTGIGISELNCLCLSGKVADQLRRFRASRIFSLRRFTVRLV